MSATRNYRVTQGDSLRAIAAREYRDATRWIELAQLNQLKPPHIVESYDPADRLPNTVIWGDTIKILSPTINAMAPPAAELYGQDIQLTHGALVVTDGDLTRVSGVPNLEQALHHRIKTLMGELYYYPDYGCFAPLALGLKLEPIITLMGAAWVREALQREPRLTAIENVTGTASGDQLAIAARVIASGQNTPLDLNLVVAGNR